MKVRPREAADQEAARTFLARHHSLRVARLGELIHPLDHPAFVAVAADGQLLGMLTYVPGQDRRQCEILTLHAHEQWHGAGTALIEAVGQLARRQGCPRPASKQAGTRPAADSPVSAAHSDVRALDGFFGTPGLLS